MLYKKVDAINSSSRASALWWCSINFSWEIIWLFINARYLVDFYIISCKMLFFKLFFQQGLAINLTDTFFIHFKPLEDPRDNTHNTHRRLHNFYDILVIAILGTICGADGWTDICEFSEARLDWLKTFLELPHGIPSHDTFGRVFSLLDAETFESCFLAWIESLSIDLKNEIISIDGKSLRGSHDTKKGQKMLHMVSAWASENRMLLGQVKTEEKSNEITAIPELLDMIDVKQGIVTIDALQI